MPWSGSAGSQIFSRTDGTRTGATTWTQAAAAPVNILATDHDTHDQDVADGINACFKKDGGNTATADLPMGGFKLSNVGVAAARTQYARFSQVQDNTAQYIATVGGTADVITLTPAIAITAYAAGQRFTFIAGGTNTGATTVNVSAVGAKDIKRPDGASTALSAGDIVSGTIIDIEYDGTRFLLLNWQSGGALSALQINGGTEETTPAVGDFAPIYDLSATANRKFSLANLMKILGLMTAETTPAADDLVGIYDTNATAARSMTLANTLKVITALTAETTPAVDDELALYDLSATTTDKITLANLFKVINGLTEDTSPALADDFVPSYDTSATAAKKIKLANLPFVQGVRLGTVGATALGANGSTTDLAAGLVVIGLTTEADDPKLPGSGGGVTEMRYKPVQQNIAGAWATVSG